MNDNIPPFQIYLTKSTCRAETHSQSLRKHPLENVDFLLPAEKLSDGLTSCCEKLVYL